MLGLQMKMLYNDRDKASWAFLRPAGVCLLAVWALTILCQLPGTISFVLIPLSMLGYVAGAALLLVLTVVFLIRRRPRRAASLFLALLLPVLLWKPMNRAADLVHLALTAGFGVGQLGTVRPGYGGFVVYDWSVGLAGGPNTFLIRDPTDEIALPTVQHTHPSDENGFGGACDGRVEHLVKHYYICTF